MNPRRVTVAAPKAALHLVTDDEPVVFLEAALRPWLAASDRPGSYAHLQVNAADLQIGFPLSRRQVERLAVLLTCDHAQTPGLGPRRPGGLRAVPDPAEEQTTKAGAGAGRQNSARP